MGIEPTSQAWEARILPMNYTRIDRKDYSIAIWQLQAEFFVIFRQKGRSDHSERPNNWRNDYQVSHIRRKASIISSSVS